MITDEQVSLLNYWPKFEPAIRNWYSEGTAGLGDIIKTQQIAIDSLPDASPPINIGTGADGSTPYTTISANTTFTLTIMVSQAFSAGATLTIGSISDPSLVVGINDSDLTIVGNYVIGGQLFNTDTELFTYLNSNLSPTGAITIMKA